MAEEDEANLAAVRARLAPFLELNPASSVLRTKPKSGAPLCFVAKPWGDRSLAINVVDPSDALIAALNTLRLPERLSAIWHADIKKLEVIWTARKLPEMWEEVKERRFTFKYRGISHICHFTASSDRLLEISAATIPLASSTSGFRNMNSFST